MTLRVDQSTFQAGEIDPLAFGRVDAKSYYQGAAKFRDVVPLVTGGARRRPGSKWLAFMARTDGVKLKEFIFSDDQAYCLVFQQGTVDVYNSDGTFAVTVGGAPWLASQLAKMSFALRGDTLVITHKDMPTQLLKRTGAATFTLAALTFDTDATTTATLQPYRKYADSNMTLTPSATTGAGITLTLSAPGAWDAVNHINTLVRYKGKEIRVTAVTSATIATGTVLQTLGGTTADKTWDEQAFSAVHGYARTCVFHEDRLWLLGTRDYPPAVYASKIGLGFYFNFDQGTSLDTDAIWTAIGSENSAEIRNAVSFRNLLIFCDVGEFFIPTSVNKPITPTTISFKKQSPYGSASTRPVPFDDAVAFVQKTGTSIRELTYNDLEQAYNAFSVSTLASHLIVTPLDMCVLNGSTKRPEQLLHVPMTDGSMAVLHSNRAENFTGWARWGTNGSYLSAATVLDQVFVAVQRTINGVTKFALELLDPTLYLDCSKRVTLGVAGTAFTGFNHLANEASAYSCSGDYSLGPVAVDAGGNVTASASVLTLDVGYNFTPTIQPMPLETQNGGGFITSRPKRIVRVTCIIDKTASFEVNGNPFLFRQALDDFSGAVPLRTGRVDLRTLGWDRNGQPLITQSEPGPFTLLGFELETVVG